MNRAARIAVSLALALAPGCVAAPDEAIDEQDATEKVAKITLARRWLLKGDGLTSGDPQVTATFTLPKSYKRAAVAVDSAQGAVAVERGSDGKFNAAVDVTKLTPGPHTLMVVSSDRKRTLGRVEFQLSAPLYVVVSTDWDDTRMSDAYLARMDGVRQNHPELKVTQFFAPYHYTDPQLTPTRKQQIDTWIKQQRDQYGDELGVHIHGWCHFVTTAGVTCRTKESFYVDDGSGYTTILASYTEDEMTKILTTARKTYAAHGLGSPTSFRAGGWTADIKVLRALAKTGFAVDSSAVPAGHLASWKGYGLWDWTTTHWKGITETTQPYFPLDANPAAADPQKKLALLEVPDNGVLVDYVSAEEMVNIYEMNHDASAVPTADCVATKSCSLAQPTVYQIGWHPPNFSNDYMGRIDAALDVVDQHLYSDDAGPARYVTISELTKVWRR